MWNEKLSIFDIQTPPTDATSDECFHDWLVKMNYIFEVNFP